MTPVSTRAMTMAHKDEFYRVVGERLRSVREKADLSINDLAKLAGINPSTIQNAEIGQACSLYVLAILAEQLDGVTLDDLVPVEALT